MRATRGVMAAVLIVVCVAAAASALAEDPELSEWLPSWEQGLVWEVETQPVAVAAPMGPGGTKRVRSSEKVIVKFEVTGAKEIEGNDCWELTVTNPITPETSSVLYVKKRDYTVAEMHTVQKKKDGSEGKRSVKKAGPGGPFVLLEEGFLCPLDLPTFPAEAKDAEIEGTLPGTKVKQVEKRRFEKKGDAELFVVEIHTEWNGEALVSKQTWRKGGPWWVEASRTVGGREVETGKLVVGKK